VGKNLAFWTNNSLAGLPYIFSYDCTNTIRIFQQREFDAGETVWSYPILRGGIDNAEDFNVYNRNELTDCTDCIKRTCGLAT
jgi:hypothetical protein